MKIKRSFIFCAVLLAATVVAAHAQKAQPPAEILKRYLSDLQDSPEDVELREKIIQFVLTLDPPPRLPDEAEHRMARGIKLVNRVTNVEDYKNAAVEFQQAVNAAPWLTQGYNNLAIVQEKCGMYTEAIKNWKFFLLAAPKAPNVSQIRDKIVDLELLAEKKASDSNAKKKKSVSVPPTF